MAELQRFYDVNTIVSMGIPMNAVIGARSAGKTEGFKNHFVKRFKRKGEMFVYGRRYQDDIDTMLDFWKLQKELFPKYTFDTRVEKKIHIATIDGEDAGYLIAVNTAQKRKSGFTYDNVRWFVYDEFLADNNEYAPREAAKLASLIWTIKRLKTAEEFQVFLLGNAVEKENPHFFYFNMHVDTNKRFTKSPKNFWCVENVDSDSIGAIQEIKEDLWGQFIADTAYGAYALDNKFSDDNNNMIRERSKDAVPLCLIVYEQEYYGMWYSVSLKAVFIDTKHNKAAKHIIAIEQEDLDEGIAYKKSLDGGIRTTLIKARDRGLLFFTNQRVRTKGLEILKALNVL